MTVATMKMWDHTPRRRQQDPPTEPTTVQETRTFVLEEVTQFGFHNVASHQIKISDDGLSAEKKDPDSHYAHGVAYGARPLKGTAEFEVKISSYGTGWSGTLKLGVMRCKKDMPLISGPTIPRYSPEGVDHCVWSSDKLHNRLNAPVETNYGLTNLDDLREGDRVGLRLSHDGVLVFFVNGKSQGIAAENIYDKNCDVYAVVDHYANCKATSITRAGTVVMTLYHFIISHSYTHTHTVMRVDFNLQELCLEKLSSWLKNDDKVDRLPLPIRLKDRLKQFINE